MGMRVPAAIIVVSLLCGLSGPQGESQGIARLTSASGLAAQSDYERQMQALNEEMRTRAIAIRSNYLAALGQAEQRAIDANDSDEVQRIAAEKKRVSELIAVGIDGRDREQGSHAFAQYRLTGSGYTLQRLQHGARWYSNRDYEVSDLPKCFDRWSFTQIAAQAPPRIYVERTEPGLVYLAVDDKYLDEIVGLGWSLARLPEASGGLTFRVQGRPIFVVQRWFGRGEPFELPRVGWGQTIVLVPPGAEIGRP